MIEELKKHLLSEGKTDSWLNLAIQFNILPNGTNKQRSDKVRQIASKINKRVEYSGYVQTLPLSCTSFSEPVCTTSSTTYKDGTVVSTYNEYPSDISMANSLRDNYGNMLGNFYYPYPEKSLPFNKLFLRTVFFINSFLE